MKLKRLPKMLGTKSPNYLELLVSHLNSDGYVDLATALIEKSGLFDPEYYLESNPDVKASGLDPLRHFVMHGGVEGRNPSELFDSNDYLAHHADVREMGVNPLIHYILLGVKNESRLVGEAESKEQVEYNNYIISQRLISEILDEQDVAKDAVFKISAKPVIDNLLKSNKKLVVYPLSYPLDIVQRPEHFFRYMFEEHAVPTLIIENNGTKKPYIKQIRDGVYVTNMLSQTTRYLKDKQTILYITYPFYSVFIPALQPGKILYDVIDDLSCFSGSLKGLRADHKRLLKIADVVTYTSKELLKKDNAKDAKNCYLAENGVWPNDFATKGAQKKYSFKQDNEVVIGYYGAVGNLLDWKLLTKLARIPNVRLVFIGPKANFVNASVASKKTMEALLSAQNVTYLESARYEDLPKYASNFDAAIVPFEVSDITDPVSPLKLFEYMAAGLKVFATPTKTLSEYKGTISVAADDEFIDAVKNWISHGDAQTPDYKKAIDAANWSAKFAKPVKTLLAMRETSHNILPKNVDIINVNFYDQQGNVLYKGGAERYVFDLARVLISMGHQPRILQNATKEFKKTYRGVEVVGVVTGVTDTSGPSLRHMSKVFNEACKDSDLVIASPIDLACEIKSVPVIGISHGIHWDTKLKRLANNRSSDYKEIFDALRNVRTGICVDTNFINWTRTYDYSLGEKLRYIPNYYDKNEFKFTKKNYNGRLRIMYPRRLYDARGIFITLEAFDYLLSKYNDIDLLLVGQTTDPKVIKAVKDLMKKYKEQVTLEEYDMEDMHKAYAKSNVVLIPTRYAEGTSLSCLEAMATNNALIATNIGGLPNLVVDGYNGLLIDPNPKALIEAVESIADDRKLASKLAENGEEMVKVFEKDNWNKRWIKIFEEEL